jgi:ABC-2 type transport system permease protein
MTTATITASDSMPRVSGDTPVAGRPSFFRTAVVLLRMTWARTTSPALILGIVGLVLLPMLFAILFASRGPMSGDAVPFLIERFDQLVLALATPIIALLLGTSAFNAEAEDGTLLYLVTTTTPRWWIAVVRVLFAAVLTAALSALAIWGTGYLVQGNHDRDGVTRAFTIAAAFAGAVYASFFTLLALITRRALVVGLGYIIFWEGLLSTTFPGINYLSIRPWALAVASEYAEVANKTFDVGPSMTAALTGGSIVMVFAVLIATKRLAIPRHGKT